MSIDGQLARQSLKQVTQHSSTRLAEGRVSLDYGRFEPATAIKSLLVVLAVLAVSALSGMLVWSVSPGHNEQWSTVGGLRGFLASWGILVLVTSYVVAGVAGWIVIYGWSSFIHRQHDWHIAELSAFEAASGVEHETTVTITELSSSRVLDVLAVALSVHQRVLAGDRTPYSVRELEGDHWLTTGTGQMVKLGSVGAGESERLGKLLSDLKLVRGRAKAKAGEWVPETFDDVVSSVTTNWVKR